MDCFNKFYSKAHPLVHSFISEHHKVLPVIVQNAIWKLFSDIMLLVSDIYKKEILKEKYDLDIDLTKFDETEKPGETYIQRFSPCEICGQTRVVHQCHIIPRNLGGADMAKNFVILCANHHYLFDRHSLTKDEWGKIDWSKKAPEAQEFVNQVRLPKQQMFWKYKAPSIVGCECGSQDFETFFEEIERPAPGITRELKCKSCGNTYCASTLYGYEYHWWWDFVKKKFQR